MARIHVNQVFTDTFTRADSSTTLGSTSDGKLAWTALDGTWGIASNKAYCVALNAGQAIAAIDPGVGNYVSYKATLNLGTSSVTGLAFRIIDASNYLSARLDRTAGNMVLLKRVGGANTVLLTVSTTVTAGVDYILEVNVSDRNIIISKDGAVIGSYILTSAEYALFTSSITKVGLRASNLTDSPTFDNLSWQSTPARTTAGNRQVVRDFGTCLDFDGNSGNVQVTDSASLDLTGDFSISVWIKPTTIGEGNGGRIIEKANAYVFLIGSNNAITLTNNTTNATSNNNAFKLGIWQHVVATYSDSGNVTSIYVDGVSVGTPTQNVNPGNNNNDLYIGNRSAGDRTFKGKIDDLRIYKDRVLTPTEITNLYYGIEPTTTGLSAWWKFDEGSGSTANDSSGNSNTGTITTATYSADVFIKPRTAV